MRIAFSGNINHDYMMVNTVTFELANGTAITVDREWTEYDINEIDGTYSMVWRGCYLWALNDWCIFGDKGHHISDDYSISEFTELVKEAKVSFDLEDDAEDEDYEVTITGWEVY